MPKFLIFYYCSSIIPPLFAQIINRKKKKGKKIRNPNSNETHPVDLFQLCFTANFDAFISRINALRAAIPFIHTGFSSFSRFTPLPCFDSRLHPSISIATTIHRTKRRRGKGRRREKRGKALKQRLCLCDYFRASLPRPVLCSSSYIIISRGANRFSQTRHETDHRFEKIRVRFARTRTFHSRSRQKRRREEADFWISSFFSFSFLFLN